MKKTKWNKPELIVLVRGDPKMATLFSCKDWVNIVGQGKNWHGECYYENTIFHVACYQCSSCSP